MIESECEYGIDPSIQKLILKLIFINKLCAEAFSHLLSYLIVTKLKSDFYQITL